MSIDNNKLVLGTAQFGMDYGIANKNGQVSKDAIEAILEFAFRAGINTMDTAKGYGSSEEILGYYLKDRSDEVWHIITKVNTKANSIENQVYESMDKLGITPEVVLAHSTADYLNPSFCKALHQLKDTKSIKQVGVSVYTKEDINRVLAVKIPDIIQCPLNILDTRLFRSRFLDKMKEQGISIHIRSVFLQGLFYLSDEKIQENYTDAFEAIKQLKLLAQRVHLTVAELSLLWVCSLGLVDKVIIGLESVDQLKHHLETLSKHVESALFEEALSIKYDNENILNPSLWSTLRI